MSIKQKTCLCIAHPGHELRVYGWISVAQPKVFIITNGGGSQNKSRLLSTTKVLDSLNCTCGSVYGRFPDTEIYDLLIKKEYAPILKMADELLSTVLDESYEYIVGDASEGYNPSHELCRLIINAVVAVANKKRTSPLKNYDVALVGLSNDCPDELRERAIWIMLDRQQLERKLSAANQYPELAMEVETAIRKFGVESFATECLRPVELAVQYGVPTSLPTDYEKYGEERVKAGTYKEVINYKEHMVAVKSALQEWANKQTATSLT